VTLCECRLCDWKGQGTGSLQVHLQSHGVGWVTGDGDGLEVRLHAAKDRPTESENTFGLYEDSTLVAVFIRTEERAADDPMRFEGE